MRVLAVTLLLVTVGLSGCFDPYRVHVSADTLEASPLDWNETKFGQRGGNFGTKSTETRYVFENDNQPFPGVVQIFSLRGSDRKSTSQLLAFTERIVDEAIEREGIQVDSRFDADGERELRNGVGTKWFIHTGTIESGEGDFFSPQSRITVRILGEVGFDGKSSTGFVAVAYVQVAEETGSFVPGVAPGTIEDDRTWFDVVGDPSGSVAGASFASEERGLIYNLRTHG